MRHYEIVFLVHPDQSEQVPAMVDRYRGMIEKDSGKVHRFEDWGRRQLAFQIGGVHKAHYVLLNIECERATLDELENVFRFNDAVIRSLVRRRKKAVTETSPMMQEVEQEREKERAAAAAQVSERESARSAQTAAQSGDSTAESGQTEAPAGEAAAESNPAADQKTEDAETESPAEDAETSSDTEDPSKEKE